MIQASEDATKAKDPVMSQTRLLKMAQVAKDLGVHERTVSRWVQDGLFPAPIELTERTIRWRASDVVEFLKRKSREAQKRSSLSAGMDADSADLYDYLADHGNKQ